MLKLEKTSRHSGLTVRLKEREPLFETRLLTALAIALFLHAAGLLIFQVTPFFHSSTFRFPPIEVHSNPSIQTIAALATHYLDENEEFSPPPFNKVPPLEMVSYSHNSTLAPSLQLEPFIFDPLEEHLWPLWEPPLSLKLEESAIQLAISGDLAEHPLISSDPLLSQKIALSDEGSPAYVSYQVQMNEKTGELFWYERIESSGIASIDQLTEKILLNLRFAPAGSLESVLGTLNFVVLNHQS